MPDLTGEERVQACVIAVFVKSLFPRLRCRRFPDRLNQRLALQFRYSGCTWGHQMKGPKLEKWQELCQQAANEHDPEALLKLIDEINKMLWEKEQRLKAERSGKSSTQSAAD